MVTFYVIADQASISLSNDHCAFAGLVDGRHIASRPVLGSIYLQYSSWDLRPLQYIRSIYPLNAAVTKYDVYIVGTGILYARVRRTCDLAARDRIPQRQSICQNQLFFFFYVLRNGLVEHCCNDFPEPVLRVTIEKVLLS